VWSTKSEFESHPAVVSPGKFVNFRQQSLFGKQAKLQTRSLIVRIIKTVHYFSQMKHFMSSQHGSLKSILLASSLLFLGLPIEPVNMTTKIRYALLITVVLS
jgi:hypothetical protein